MTQKDEHKTKVIFRKDRRDGEITAVFPELTQFAWNYVTCYAHVGQHSICCYQWYIQSTTPATPEEYEDLRRELEEQVGYNLEICKKWINRESRRINH